MTPQAKVQAVANILSDMQKGVPPSRATLVGTDSFTQRVVSCLPNFIPPEQSEAGLLFGVAALKHRLQRLQSKPLPGEPVEPGNNDAAPKPALTLADVEPLSVWRFWLDDAQRDKVSDMIDNILTGSSTLTLGSFADANKKAKKGGGGGGRSSVGEGAAASSTLAGGQADSGLFD